MLFSSQNFWISGSRLIAFARISKLVLGRLTVSLYFPVSVTVSCLNVGVQVIRSIIGDGMIVGCGERSLVAELRKF